LADYKDWYAKNRDRILADKKKKYKEDQAYRDRILNASKGRYVQKDVPKDRKVIVTSAGEYYSISRVAEIIKREIQTVRNYHKALVIPEPLAFDTRGWRLYNKHQVDLLADTFAKFDSGELKSLAEVADILQHDWQKNVKEEAKIGKRRKTKSNTEGSDGGGDIYGSRQC